MSVIKKCVVWDLDNTLWEGICLEENVTLRPEVQRTIEELDRRGILNSIASRGVEDVSMKILKKYGLERYFLAPQINWLPKHMNILAISRELGVSLDAMAFIDDDAFEREQIAFMLPEVMVIEDRQAKELPGRPEFSPRELTKESRSRRHFYHAEEQRKSAVHKYRSRDEFLMSCQIQLSVRQMAQDDVPRVLELMSRTHQLNTTGRIFPHHKLLSILENKGGGTEVQVADLKDRFGPYGTIGAAITRMSPSGWQLTYLAISCRVLGRGVERAFLSRLLDDAKNRDYRYAEAEFRDTGRNKEMRALYQMIGFRAQEDTTGDGSIKFRLCLEATPQPPPWIIVQ